MSCLELILTLESVVALLGLLAFVWEKISLTSAFERLARRLGLGWWYGEG